MEPVFMISVSPALHNSRQRSPKNAGGSAVANGDPNGIDPTEPMVSAKCASGGFGVTLRVTQSNFVRIGCAVANGDPNGIRTRVTPVKGGVS